MIVCLVIAIVLENDRDYLVLGAHSPPSVHEICERLLGLLILEFQRLAVVQNLEVSERVETQALGLGHGAAKMLKLSLDAFGGYGLDQIAACVHIKEYNDLSQFIAPVITTFKTMFQELAAYEAEFN